MKTFTKHILLLALMLFGVAGAAWADRAPQKFTGPVDIYDLMDGDTLAPGFSLTYGHGQQEIIRFVAGRYSIDGTPQAYPGGADLTGDHELQSLIFTASNILMYFGEERTDTIAPMVDMSTPGNAWVVSDFNKGTEGVTMKISGIYIAPDPTVPALDETTGNWNFLMPGSNKVVKAVLYDSIVLGPHVSVAVQPVQAFISYTRPGIGGDSTVLYYDPTLANSSFGFIANDDDGQGRNFAFWADDQNNHNTDRDFGGFSELTCGQRFVAVYPDNHTLTLATPQGGGTLELAGVTYDTVYNINFYHIGSPEGTRSFTIPASRLSYDTTFSYGSANVMYAEVDEQSGKLSIINRGDHTVSIRISGAFGYGSYRCRFEGMDDPDEWVITCTAGTQPKMPYGISKTGDNTYSVMEGLTVNVTATPDSAHYLSAIGNEAVISNSAYNISFTMPDDDAELAATFTTKPTLTLAQTDGGTLEAIVPQGGVTAMHLTTDQIPTWSGNTEYAMAADLQQFGFVAVDSAAAAAWTGAPASGFITLVYALAGNQFKTIVFQDGQWFAATTFDFYKADFYTSPDVFYFTTGASKSNVIASSTPNTYYIDYGTPVTVKATPDAEHYLVSFSDDAPATERNSNLAVEKTYDSVIAPINLTANFQAKPTLTLTANDGGTLTLDGMTTRDSALYDITIINQPQNITAYPYQKVFNFNGDVTEVSGGDDNVSIAITGQKQVTVTVNRGFSGHVNLGGAELDGADLLTINIPVSGTPAGSIQLVELPAGVVSANATLDTFVVDYGTELTVVATPDSIHYLATLGEELVNSNDSIHRTFTMTAPVNLPADFRAKPTLTLAHNDGGEMEVIVPQGGVTAIVPPTDQISGWEDDNAGYLTESDMPAELGFVAVDQAAAEAWTGAPASGDALLIYGINGENFYYLSFNDGSLTGNDDGFLSPGSFYQMASAGTLYITTGVTPSNVTASTEPNTYYIDYNTSVTVKATPSDTAYLVRFDNDADTNSNTAVEKTYGPLTAALTTAEATFQAKPVLTLAASDTSWGKVMLEGAGSGSSNGYTIKFSANGNTIVKENVTLPKTYQCAYGSPSEFDNIIRELYGWDGVHGNENAIPTVTGTDAITPGTVSSSNYPKFTINSAFQGTATVTIGYTNSSWVSDNWPIEISFVPALPAGVAQIDSVTYRVDYGTTLTVQADATELHHVANWEDQNGDSLQTATYSAYFVTEPVALFPDSSTLTLTVTADTTAKALFGINSYDVTAMAQLDSREEIGTGVAMGTVQATYRDIQGDAQSVAADDTITYTAQGASISTLVATPYYGYLFSQWTDTTGKKVFGTTDTLRLDSANVVVARFVPDTFAVATDLNVERMGTVTGAGRYPYLTQVTLEGVSEYGYHFDRWNDFDTNNPRTVQLVQDTAFKAFFDYDQFRVQTSSANDTMGSAIANLGTDFYCNYLYTTTFVATPATGYHFVQWSNGLTTDTARIVIVQDTVMVAFFAPNKYTVTAKSASATMGTTSGSGVYDYGTTATLVATAKTGYSFTDWSDGVTTAERTITIDFTHDTTVTANFTVNQYTVTVESADTVMGSVSGTATVDYNTRTSISATANEHYHFVKWNDGVTSATRTVTVREDVTYTATFAPDMYTITGLADQGQGSVTGSGSYAYLTNATLTATPACGYLFDHWSNLSTESSITVQVTGNETYTAFFRPSAVEVVHDTIELHDTTVVEIHDTTVVAVDTMYIPVPDTTLVPVVINDTTIVPVDIFDTTVVPVTWYDTTRVDVTWYDTTIVDVTINDTTVVPVTWYDTTHVDVTVMDTTIVPVTIVDTTLMPVVVPDTTFVPVTVYDTTVVPVTDYDTTVVPVTWYDTTVVPVTWYDTTVVPVTWYDTTRVDVTEYDTTHVDVTVVDSTLVPIHDTVIEYVEVHDTLWLVEYIYDTVYIHDTIFVGIDDVDALDAKIYANNGQIVVEGADGNKVVLYDVTGRILATKVDEYAPLRFDIPVSGTYLVKIGNHAARRIVMIR